MNRNRRLSALGIIVFGILLAWSMFSGIMGWIVIGIGGVALVVMMFMMWTRGLFMSPATLIDDVVDGAEWVRNGISKAGTDDSNGTAVSASVQENPKDAHDV